MYEKLTPIVLQATYLPLKGRGHSQEAHINNLFCDYYYDAEENPARASRIMRDGVPKKLVEYYSQSLKEGYERCPKRLYDNVRDYVHTYYTNRPRRNQMYLALLDIIRTLPEDDGAELMPNPIPQLCSADQAAHVMAYVLWYAITQDFAMRDLDIA